MTRDISVLTVIGARPQFIKAAPLSAVFTAAGGFAERLVHTGQHFDREMSEVFFAELGLAAPAINLGIHGGGHGDMTARMLSALERQIETDRPDWVLLYGDTNSTLAGALAAAKLHVPVAHVEAGLRSFNRRMPEEINRVLTDHISNLLLCPTRQAVANLTREGISDGVHAVGDVMYDAARTAAARAGSASALLDRLNVTPLAFSVATVHRAENVDDVDQLGAVLAFLKSRAEREAIVFPIHPRTRAAIARLGLDTGAVRLCSPLSYLEMTQLMTQCSSVLTDSGGLQKEAYFHGKPCVTLRTETEWVETIACGWNRLWRGPDYLPRRPIDDYGDGHAATRIVELMRNRTR